MQQIDSCKKFLFICTRRFTNLPPCIIICRETLVETLASVPNSTLFHLFTVSSWGITERHPMVQETDCHSHEWVFWANLSTWSKTAVMLGKDFFRNGQNTQFACILMKWTEKNLSFQEPNVIWKLLIIQQFGPLHTRALIEPTTWMFSKMTSGEVLRPFLKRSLC